MSSFFFLFQEVAQVWHHSEYCSSQWAAELVSADSESSVLWPECDVIQRWTQTKWCVKETSGSSAVPQCITLHSCWTIKFRPVSNKTTYWAGNQFFSTCNWMRLLDDCATVWFEGIWVYLFCIYRSEGSIILLRYQRDRHMNASIRVHYCCCCALLLGSFVFSGRHLSDFQFEEFKRMYSFRKHFNQPQ